MWLITKIVQNHAHSDRHRLIFNFTLSQSPFEKLNTWQTQIYIALFWKKNWLTTNNVQKRVHMTNTDTSCSWNFHKVRLKIWTLDRRGHGVQGARTETEFLRAGFISNRFPVLWLARLPPITASLLRATSPPACNKVVPAFFYSLN